MFRIRILLYEMEERFQSPEAELQRVLRQEGFDADFAAKSQKDLNLDPVRIAAYAEEIPCDAWIVMAGSREILLRLADGSVPVLAVFGILPGSRLPGIGPTHQHALETCINQLIDLGHRRISMFARRERRLPAPGPMEKIFLDSLQKSGLPIDGPTLPDWEESLSGFRSALDALFVQSSPPTAIIFQEPELVMAALQFFAQQGIRIPDHVSLFCCDYDPRFEWSVPVIAHSRWDYKEVVDRALYWAHNISSGVEDKAVTIMEAEFVAGGTIAPPPSDKWLKDTSGKVW